MPSQTSSGGADVDRRSFALSLDHHELGLDWWNHNGRQDRLAPEQNASLLAMDARLGRIEQALGAAKEPVQIKEYAS